jgi:alpha-D-ribose 1-methylphosphonate 5-triphosphate synthase subunit PhnH
MQREIAYDEVFDAQEHYRQLLDCMARPGTINLLSGVAVDPPPGLHMAGALVAFALLNADTVCYTVGDESVAINSYLVLNTMTETGTKYVADYIFAKGAVDGVNLLDGTKRGSLAYPEESVTLVLAVDALATERQGLPTVTALPSVANHSRQIPPDLELTLQGPGIPGKKKLFVRGLDPTIPAALQQCNAEFPIGVDLVLTDPAHRIACIPRSSQVSCQKLEQ